SFTCTPHSEPLAPVNPFKGKMELLLAHQWQTYLAVRDADLVLNTASTGTGKTTAALLGLLHFPGSNVLFIAPTNALVQQHAEDVRQFVFKHGLPHLVAGVQAEVLRELPAEPADRSGEKLYRLVAGPAQILQDQRGFQAPLILVTNPDIFYYALMYLYNPLDRRNLAREFMCRFDYIIIDELHYYSAKQLSFFLYFIIMSYALGYFAEGRRKIIILTATPGAGLRCYIERLKERGLKVVEIGRPEVPGVPVTPVLAPCRLQIRPLDRPADFPGALAGHLSYLEAALAGGRDGLIISDSLRSINLAARWLKNTSLAGKFARITGPVPGEEREKAAFYPLILATPTVDIGYNFKGKPKDRQNIDFIIFQSRFADAFWQRLGRAGRVLGKNVTDYPAEAFAYMPAEVALSLRDNLPGGTITREELVETINSELVERRLFSRPFHGEYVSSFALKEMMYPLLNIHRLLPGELRTVLESAFEMLKGVFSPASRYTFHRLYGEMAAYKNASDFLQTVNKSPGRADRKKLVLFLRQAHCGLDRAGEERAVELYYRGDEEFRQWLKHFLHNKISPYQALFRFRDSGGAGNLRVAVYDAEGLLGEQKQWLIPDTWHFWRNFSFQLCEKLKALELTGSVPPQADLYAVAKDILPVPYTIRLKYRLRFEEMYELENRLGSFVALAGPELEFLCDGALVPVPGQVRHALQGRHLYGLILSREFKPVIIHRCFKEDIFPMELVVRDGSREKDFYFFAGAAAYYFYARFGWSLKSDGGWVIV
ncbi:MAG: type I-D CRISPR-associated helicase Cas3', partial [Peptococcaceae bacterium]|nr:type I-D CRISPR-associated helicase Cas3' [Peptococcaceae bacterium]